MPPALLFILAIAALLIAIIYLDVHPFLALIIAGILLGISAGMPLESVSNSILEGFAETLRWIGIVMVLGTLIGDILTKSGGTRRISNSMIRAVGTKRLPLAMAMTGYVVAIPVFVDVAYIMMRPITESLAAESRTRVLVVGLSLTAGLTATHALMPPTPGPLALLGILGADIGRLILINAVVAVCAVLGGLMWAVVYCSRVPLSYDDILRENLADVSADSRKTYRWRGTVLAFASILVPLILMALASVLNTAREIGVISLITFLGTPIVALLVGMLIALLVPWPGEKMNRLGSLVNHSIEKAAIIVMITGAGGAFGKVIIDAELAVPMADMIQRAGLPAVLLPFLLAMAFTTATGSLTISMVTTASIVLPMQAQLGLSAEIAAAMIGAGALGIIHVNSSFFWLLSRMHEVPTSILYKTFVAQSFIMAISGGLGALFMYFLGVR